LSFCPAHSFPNNWKIDGDYPPAGGQCNSFLAEFTGKRRGAENAENRRAGLTVIMQSDF
jgi:hypothetical protein